MLAVLTGATGLLGANLAEALLAAGHTVCATKRGSSRTDHLTDLDVTWVEADLGDEAALTEAFAGADVVFHCAAAVSIAPRSTPALVEANVEGTRRALSAARAAGARRVVYTSSTVCIGVSDGEGTVDEDARWNLPERGLADGYAVTKRDAEAVALAAAADGQDVVIVNPGYMFGPRDVRPSSGKLILGVVKGQTPGYTPGANSFVDVRDVARGMIAAAQRGRSGERYILAGHNLSYREIFAAIAGVAGTRAPTWAVPRWLTGPIGALGDLGWRLTGREPLITSAAVAWGNCADFRPSCDKAARELGYVISPIEPAIRDALAWFVAQGMWTPTSNG